jgi:hypothetical protein
MPATDLHEEYLDLLLDNASASRFPSGELLDRIEAVLTPERAEEYVELLLDLSRGAFPNYALLDRAHLIVRSLELYEQRNQ